ncbi:MAG: DUF3098 domain-containing protein [Bacteroidales bacterium]|nr:DUF3098 domain-containing protein [Bacteroidales bacterium]
MNQKNVKNTTKKGVTAKNSAKPEWAPGMPFTTTNYLLMVAGVIILLIGYFMLSGGGSDDPSQFSDAIFNARRLKVAPVILIVGFVVELFAIMYRPRKQAEAQEPEAETKA